MALLEDLRDPNFIGQEGMRRNAADRIEWLTSSLVSLLTLAEAEHSPLTNKQVASICKIALDEREAN